MKAGRWSELDVANLVEELEDMGQSREGELESRLGVLLTHLLKMKGRMVSKRYSIGLRSGH